MTEDQLSRTLHDATLEVESRLAPDAVWASGRHRRRRTAATAVGLAAASVAAVAAISAGIGGADGQAPGPAPSPAPTQSTDDAEFPGLVTRQQLLPMTDALEWPDLPAYPEDLGSWTAPERAVPLAEDPVDHATVALQSDLGGGRADLVVRGDDGRWRRVDLSRYELDGGEGGLLGLHRGSLSPDGTRLALGVPSGIVMVDLTTADTTEFDVPGLVEIWETTAGRNVFWSADGSAVLVSQGYWATSQSGRFTYAEGWRIDVSDGSVTRTPYDAEYAALFADGTVLADRWGERTGHRWVRYSADGSQVELDTSTDLLGVLSEPSAQGDLWVARRELTAGFPDRRWDRSGFLALDSDGDVVSLLPVGAVDRNGGGGRVLGWVDETVVLIGMPGEAGANGAMHTLAWDVLSGETWRGPSTPYSTRVALPRP